MTSSNRIALSASGLSIGYSGRSILSGLDLTLHTGIVTALLGANGAGKSTLLRTLCGEQPSLGGSVELFGRPLASYSRRELARTVALVTTDRVAAGGMTVYEAVSTGRYPYTGAMARLSRADRDIVERAMLSVGINHKAGSALSELSDGERQKCFIAKALAQSTPLIMLDEPFSFLDTAARIETFDLLRRLASTENKAVLLTSHDVTQAVRMAGQLWLITADLHVYGGTPAELVADGRVANLFASPDVIYDVEKNDFILRQK